MIPVPANPADAQWTNLAPGATVTYSSLHSSLPNGNGAVDRKVKMRIAYNNHYRYWQSREGQSPNSQWLQLTFPVPVTVKTVRLYNIPASESSIKVMNTTVQLFSDKAGTNLVASSASGALSENGTDVPFTEVRARVVRILFTSVNGTNAGLGEVEVIARAEADVPDSVISGNVGTGGVTLNISGVGQTTSAADGSYSTSVPFGWNGTVTPTHACYTFNPPSLSFTNLNANATAQNFTSTFNTLSGCANVDIYIGGANRGNMGIPPQSGQRVAYNLDSGPVKVVSNNGVSIVAGLRDALSVNGQTVSFAQLMGLPQEQLSDTYWFPAYNNMTLSGQLRIANVDSVSTTVKVKIGGVERGSYTLAPNASIRPTFNLDSGPVQVYSTNGAKIIVALRDAWLNNGQATSFVQMMGLPKEALSDTYWFPAYNNVTLSGQLRISNVDTVSTTVTVKIGGVVRGTYNLAPNSSVRPTYNLDNGPVQVYSSNGAKIIAALRDAWQVNGTVTSFSQMMGLPKEKLSTTYYLPAYNNVNLDGQLRIGNVDTISTTVTVKIGGVVRGTYNLSPNASVRPTFALDSGPVEVYSSNGARIIVAIRDAWKVNGQVTSFVQTMAIPKEAMSTTYWFPAYNNVTLSGQLRFGVP